MRGLVQRVTRASVTIDGEVVGQIGPGICLLVGVTHDDDAAAAEKLAGKVWNLRILADRDGAMNLSLSDRHETGESAELLVVSQFTLAADTAGGNRPSFSGAAPPALGRELYEAVLRMARERHAPLAAGEFGADMQVHLVNDGPVTIPLRIA